MWTAFLVVSCVVVVAYDSWQLTKMRRENERLRGDIGYWRERHRAARERAVAWRTRFEKERDAVVLRQPGEG